MNQQGYGLGLLSVDKTDIVVHSKGKSKTMQQRFWFHLTPANYASLCNDYYSHTTHSTKLAPSPSSFHFSTIPTLIPSTCSSCQDDCPQLSDSGFSGFLLTLIKPQWNTGQVTPSRLAFCLPPPLSPLFSSWFSILFEVASCALLIC